MSQITQALIQAEKSFLDQLTTLVEKYLKPLSNEESSPLIHSVVANESEDHHQEENCLHNISSSLNIITKLHQFTLSRLEGLSSDSGLGALFSTITSQLLAPYKQYYTSVPKIISYLEKEKQTNEAYKKWLNSNDENLLHSLLVSSPQDHLNVYVKHLKSYESTSDITQDEKKNVEASLDYLIKTSDSIVQAQHAKHHPVRRLSEKL